ncbi:MAG: alpha/beta hydrolase [Burkholderiaceae bacterium]
MGFVVNEGVRIRFDTVGQGRPLLLHHGRLEDASVWHESGWVEALQPGRQLILLDARGHGASDKPHESSAYGARTMASDMVAVLDALAIEKADVFGYSMGGRIGFMGVAYFPQRFGALVAGGAAPYGPALGRDDELAMSASLAGGMTGYLARLETMLGCRITGAKRAALLANDALAVAAMTRAMADWSPVVDLVRASGVPVQLFGGTTDALWPRIGQCHEALPGSALAALSGMDHIEVFTRRDQVLPIVASFLARHA